MFEIDTIEKITDLNPLTVFQEIVTINTETNRSSSDSEFRLFEDGSKV